MTEKLGQIQGKCDSVRVSGEFELSEFELPGSTVYIWHLQNCSYSETAEKQIMETVFYVLGNTFAFSPLSIFTYLFEMERPRRGRIKSSSSVFLFTNDIFLFQLLVASYKSPC